MGGAITTRQCRQIAAASDRAVREGPPGYRAPLLRRPVKPADGAEAMDGAGQIVAAIVRGSARYRQIPVTLGPQRVRLPRAQSSMTETDITLLCRGPGGGGRGRNRYGLPGVLLDVMNITMHFHSGRIASASAYRWGRVRRSPPPAGADSASSTACTITAHSGVRSPRRTPAPSKVVSTDTPRSRCLSPGHRRGRAGRSGTGSASGKIAS